MCDLQINKIIEIEVKSGEFTGNYPSRIEEIENNKLLLAAPISQGNVIPLTNGTEIKVSFLHQNALFYFDTVIVERKFLRLPLLVVKMPENLNRTQRRNYVRWEARLPVDFALLNSDFTTYSETHKVRTIDISGGGVKFTTVVPLIIDDALNMEINLAGLGTVNTIGQVVRVQEAIEDNEPKYLCSIAFTLIEESERDKIIGYIFEQQRQLRAKGLL